MVIVVVTVVMGIVISVVVSVVVGVLVSVVVGLSIVVRSKYVHCIHITSHDKRRVLCLNANDLF